MRPLQLALVGVLVVAAAPALAQTAPSASPATPPAGTIGSTATGAAPEKTGSTTATGQTKPPGATEGPGLGTRPDLEQKSRQLDHQINTGICAGCK